MMADADRQDLLARAQAAHAIARDLHSRATRAGQMAARASRHAADAEDRANRALADFRDRFRPDESRTAAGRDRAANHPPESGTR